MKFKMSLSILLMSIVCLSSLTVIPVFSSSSQDVLAIYSFDSVSAPYKNDVSSSFWGQATGTVSQSSTSPDNSVVFSGTGTTNYISTGIDLTNYNQFSVSVWFKLDGSKSSRQMIVAQDYQNDRVFTIEYDPNKPAGTQLYSYDGGSTIQPSTSSGVTIVANQWYHVVVTHSSSEYKLYLNANLIASGSGSTYTSSNIDLRIGDRAYSTSPDDFKGQINDVRVYSKFLSNSELSQLFTNEIAEYKLDTNFADSNGVGLTYDGQPHGNVYIDSQSQTAVFDGSAGDYVSTGIDLTNFNQFTISVWFKLNGSINTRQVILGQDYQNDRVFTLEYDPNKPAGTQLYSYDGATTIQPSTTSGVTIVAGQWYHAVVTHSSSIYKLFLQDVIIASGPGRTYSSSSIDLRIGNRAYSTSPNDFKGEIKNILINSSVKDDFITLDWEEKDSSNVYSTWTISQLGLSSSPYNFYSSLKGSLGQDNYGKLYFTTTKDYVSFNPQTASWVNYSTLHNSNLPYRLNMLNLNSGNNVYEFKLEIYTSSGSKIIDYYSDARMWISQAFGVDITKSPSLGDTSMKFKPTGDWPVSSFDYTVYVTNPGTGYLPIGIKEGSSTSFNEQTISLTQSELQSNSLWGATIGKVSFDLVLTPTGTHPATRNIANPTANPVSAKSVDYSTYFTDYTTWSVSNNTPSTGTLTCYQESTLGSYGIPNLQFSYSENDHLFDHDAYCSLTSRVIQIPQRHSVKLNLSYIFGADWTGLSNRGGYLNIYTQYLSSPSGSSVTTNTLSIWSGNIGSGTPGGSIRTTGNNETYGYSSPDSNTYLRIVVQLYASPSNSAILDPELFYSILSMTGYPTDSPGTFLTGITIIA